MPIDSPSVDCSPASEERTKPTSQKAPIPAAVASIFATFRKVFRKAEDEQCLEREGATLRDTRGWDLTFVVEHDELDGGFIAECPELPGAMSQGETEQEALENLGDAVDGIVTVRVQQALRELDVARSGLHTYRIRLS